MAPYRPEVSSCSLARMARKDGEPRFKDTGKNVPAGSILTKDYIYVRTAKRKTYRDKTPTEYRLPPIRVLHELS